MVEATRGGRVGLLADNRPDRMGEVLMTAPLTDSEIKTARERARMKPWWTFAGTLKTGESFYLDKAGGFAVEKDKQFLVEPTPAELAEIEAIQYSRPSTARFGESDDLAPARGIIIGMLIGLALCLALGLVIYRTFF